MFKTQFFILISIFYLHKGKKERKNEITKVQCKVIKTLRNKITERKSRRNNIKIDGVRESEKETMRIQQKR